MRIAHTVIDATSMSTFRVWLVFFAYSVTAAAFVQLVALPFLFPEFHLRDGLLIVGDWDWFHRVAEQMSKAIRLHGWSQWSVRPANMAPAGIAAAFYAVFVPKPYVLIPLFAGLHATGAVMVMRLMELFGIRRRLAVFTAMPFLLGPTALLWFTQIHKDSYYTPGLILCLYGWVYLMRMKTVGGKDMLVSRLVVFLLSVSSGVFLVWVVRPHCIEMIAVFALIMAMLGACVMAIRVCFGWMPWRNAAVVVIALVTVPAVLLMAEFPKVTQGMSYFVSATENEKVVGVAKNGKVVYFPEGEKAVRVSKGVNSVGIVEPLWQTSRILPDQVDRILTRVYAYRQYFYRATLYKNPGSTFDQGHFLNSFENMVRYLPRAIQVGMFAPYPKRWFQSGTAHVYTVMRRVNGLEMFCLYLAMIGLVPAIYYWRRKIEIWVIFIFFLHFTVVPVYLLPNVGTLIRYRYAPLMTLAGLGVAGLGVWLQGRRQARHDSSKQSIS